jgi:hypothetical protein
VPSHCDATIVDQPCALDLSASCANISPMTEELRIPQAMRDRAQTIIEIVDAACREHLDDEYARLTRRLVARLARKRPSPLARGDARIWAAGAIYVLGQLNFLFDRSNTPHMTVDALADALGVVKTTMANKAALIRKTLGLGALEPDLTRIAVLQQHPLAWLVQIDGLIVDARSLAPELQDEVRRLGLIPDLDALRVA